MFEKKKMSPLEQKAKLKALKEAHGMASEMMKDGLEKAKGLKKVTVASDSKEGLKEGLEKAEELVGERESDDMEMSEGEEMESDEFEGAQEAAEPMDEDELDAQIQHLMMLKKKLQAK